jgi:hypothetical protein
MACMTGWMELTGAGARMLLMGRWEGDFDFSDFSVPMGLNFVSREIGSHHAP